MNRPIRRSMWCACALAALAPAVRADVAGHCELGERRFELIDGVAWGPPGSVTDAVDVDAGDGEGAGGGATALTLAFTTFAVDAGALARAADRDAALLDQTWAAPGDQGRLVLGITDGAVATLSAYLAPGTSLSRSGAGVGRLALATVGERPAGTYEYADDEDGGLRCRLEFDVAHLGDPADAPPPPGTPLPADGGEPGRAYLAVNAALRAGDLDALARLLPPSRLALLEPARDSPDFAAQLALLKTMAPTDIRITGGRIDGDTAWVEFTAVEFGSARAGTAEMVREDGRWFVKSERTRDP